MDLQQFIFLYHTLWYTIVAMNFIALLIGAYILISLSALVDKFIITKALPHPFSYAFLISIIGSVAVLFIPISLFVPDQLVHWPSLFEWGVIILGGGGYTLAVYLLYSALEHREASRIFPLVGAITAVATLLLSFIFLSERLSSVEISAFCLLLIGGFVVGYEKKKHLNKRAAMGFIFAIVAGAVFGISYTAADYVYDSQGFLAGFGLIRLLAAVVIIVPLTLPRVRKLLRKSFKRGSGIRKRSIQLVLVGGQVATGLGFLLMNYAISVGRASIVVAAQGLQYVFLLLFIGLISIAKPKIIKEDFSATALMQKVLGIVLIIGGLALLGWH